MVGEKLAEPAAPLTANGTVFKADELTPVPSTITCIFASRIKLRMRLEHFQLSCIPGRAGLQRLCRNRKRDLGVE
jgi:hypothetical protein